MPHTLILDKTTLLQGLIGKLEPFQKLMRLLLVLMRHHLKPH
jgi:hypothetical protein